MRSLDRLVDDAKERLFALSTYALTATNDNEDGDKQPTDEYPPCNPNQGSNHRTRGLSMSSTEDTSSSHSPSHDTDSDQERTDHHQTPKSDAASRMVEEVSAQADAHEIIEQTVGVTCQNCGGGHHAEAGDPCPHCDQVWCPYVAIEDGVQSPCGKTFDNKKAMKLHHTKVHDVVFRKHRICPVCDTRFPVSVHDSDQTYCCSECASTARTERVNIICEHCEEEFSVKPSDEPRRTYCDEDCRTAALREKDCPECGDSVPNAIRFGGYCSQFCRDIGEDPESVIPEESPPPENKEEWLQFHYVERDLSQEQVLSLTPWAKTKSSLLYTLSKYNIQKEQTESFGARTGGHV